MIAVAPRGRAHAAERVGAGARLGEPQRADQRALAQAGQVFLLLRRRGVAEDVVDAQVVVGEHAQDHIRVPAGERLSDQSLGEGVEARAAQLLGHRDAEIAALAEEREQVLRPPLLVVHLRQQRMQFLAREAVGLVEDLAIVRREAERGLRLGHVIHDSILLGVARVERSETRVGVRHGRDPPGFRFAQPGLL